MEVVGKSMVAAPANVIFLSTILGRDGPVPVHKCDWKCENEHVCGNMYRCKLTGLTHICDKNCNQRILYDNHSSLCRASGQIFPFTPAEEQAVRGVRRKLDAENSSPDNCAFKRRRDAQFHPSPFERSFSSVILLFLLVGDKAATDELKKVVSFLTVSSIWVFREIILYKMVSSIYEIYGQTSHVNNDT